MKLYDYYRSSASYRLRIALAVKGLPFEHRTVHLLRGGGEQHLPAFTALHPAELVPLLEHNGEIFAQSLAIIEYLEEIHPDPPLLPRSAASDRAWTRQIALAVACDIHPLNNLRVLKFLSKLGLDESARNIWARHWIEQGLGVLERMLRTSSRRGKYCLGDSPTIADVCLIPQLFNARRFETNVTAFPTLLRIEEACLARKDFQAAHPSNQPDADVSSM